MLLNKKLLKKGNTGSIICKYYITYLIFVNLLLILNDELNHLSKGIILPIYLLKIFYWVFFIIYCPQ